MKLSLIADCSPDSPLPCSSIEATRLTTFADHSLTPPVAYRETAEAVANVESVIDDLLTGQFNHPARIVAFNTSQGWSRDVSEDVAREVMRRVALRGRPLVASSRKFVETYVDEDELLRAESGAA